MALSKLGKYIEQVDIRNSDGIYGTESLRGISINKVLTPTKADTSNLNLKPYKVVKHNWFTYCTVTSRNGNKISLAYNDDEDCIVSSINPVFRVKDETKILPRYLMMFFNRAEFDRYARFNSWGSARETFNWEDFCDIELEVPSIEIQKKYVAIYEGMLANLHSYEKGLDDLKLVCDGYIEDLRRNYPLVTLKDHIEYVNDRNSDGKITNFKGIDNTGAFIEPKRISIAPLSLKIVKNGDIVFNHALECVTDKFSFAYRDGDTCVVSNSYQVFRSTDTNYLLDKYIILWTNRREFARYAKFISFGTAHENFEYSDLEQVRIPIPPLEVQKSVIQILDSITSRKKYNQELKDKISSICPVLIRGSILEAQGGN